MTIVNFSESYETICLLDQTIKSHAKLSAELIVQLIGASEEGRAKLRVQIQDLSTQMQFMTYLRKRYFDRAVKAEVLTYSSQGVSK